MLTDCIDCGRCINICPITHTELKPFLLAWDQSDDTNQFWNCTNCWKCQEVCPQGIDLWDLRIKGRLATAPPPQFAQSLYLLETYGTSLPFTSDLNTSRELNQLEPFELLDPAVIDNLLK